MKSKRGYKKPFVPISLLFLLALATVSCNKPAVELASPTPKVAPLGLSASPSPVAKTRQLYEGEFSDRPYAKRGDEGQLVVKLRNDHGHLFILATLKFDTAAGSNANYIYINSRQLDAESYSEILTGLEERGLRDLKDWQISPSSRGVFRKVHMWADPTRPESESTLTPEEGKRLQTSLYDWFQARPITMEITSQLRLSADAYRKERLPSGSLIGPVIVNTLYTGRERASSKKYPEPW